MRFPRPGRFTLSRWCRMAGWTALLVFAAGPATAGSTVYKWVDEYGTMHLSTTRPPAGVKYQTLSVGSMSGGSSRASSGSAGTAPKPAASRPPTPPQQVAQRTEVLASLQNRECVLAIEALERLTSGTQRTTSQELRRLDQTVEANCSRDPARRREQEQMAAKLREAGSAECVAARNRLASMMAPGANTPRAQLQDQQAFVDERCTAPVQ